MKSKSMSVPRHARQWLARLTPEARRRARDLIHRGESEKLQEALAPGKTRRFRELEGELAALGICVWLAPDFPPQALMLTASKNLALVSMADSCRALSLALFFAKHPA